MSEDSEVEFILGGVGAGLVIIGGAIVKAFQWLSGELKAIKKETAEQREICKQERDEDKKEIGQIKYQLGKLEGRQEIVAEIRPDVQEIKEELKSLSSQMLEAVTDEDVEQKGQSDGG